MKTILVTLTLIVIHSGSYAQPAEDSVKQIISQMFTAMKTSDVTLLKSSFTDSAILQTIATDRKTGKIKVRTDDVNAFAQMVGKLPKDSADERIVFEMVKVDADLASAWTPYMFYYSGRFSHCGVNSFQLVRINGAWKIHYLIDTRRKQNCNN